MEHPAPDSKDWTWVLERPCPECHFDVASIDRNRLGALFRANAAAWRAILSRGSIVTRRPPSPDGTVVWSALEYGAHVRDVYQLFHDRVRDMLTKDGPTFRNWNQDRAAIEGRYQEEDPGRVAYRLAVTSGEVADIVDRIHGDQWDRTGARSDGSTFTVASLLDYLLHDVTHHVHDAEAGFEAIAEADAELADDLDSDGVDGDGTEGDEPPGDSMNGDELDGDE